MSSGQGRQQDATGGPTGSRVPNLWRGVAIKYNWESTRGGLRVALRLTGPSYPPPPHTHNTHLKGEVGDRVHDHGEQHGLELSGALFLDGPLERHAVVGLVVLADKLQASVTQPKIQSRQKEKQKNKTKTNIVARSNDPRRRFRCVQTFL